MKIIAVAACCVAALVGCSQVASSPGQQCLNSFRMDLKDPESGKVIDFKDGVLTYTATNSYGARTQGFAICVKSGENWSRDRRAEELKVLQETASILKAFNQCRDRGGSREVCSGDTPAFLLPSHISTDTTGLEKHVRRSLGYE